MVNDTEHLEISIEEDKGKPPTDGHPTDLSMICISMLLVLLQGKSRPKRRTDMRRDGIHQGILSPNQMVIQVSTGSLDQVMTPGSKAPPDKPARTSPTGCSFNVARGFASRYDDGSSGNPAASVLHLAPRLQKR